MTLKDFKSKLAEIDFKTGAKKVAATATIVAVMLSSVPVAHAAVNASNIIGDAQVTEDRTNIKRDDAQDIYKHFYGFDKNGVQTITMDDVSKAIELSNMLNDYYFDLVEYTNTTKEEVIDLDVDLLYEQYLIDTQGERFSNEGFCKNHLEYKPAIDAFITFSCGTVSNNLKASVADSINAVITTEGFKMTQKPKVLVRNNTLYVILEVEGQTQIVELVGELAADIVRICSSLDNHYYTALENIGGYSNEYEDSFAYNGIDSETNESVWLSYPDEGKQIVLQEGMSIYSELMSLDGIEYRSASPEARRELTKEEQTMLRELGYDKYQIKNAVGRETYIGRVQKTLSK